MRHYYSMLISFKVSV